MKLLTILFLISAITYSSNTNFLPENDLWQEDYLESDESNIDKELYLKILKAGKKVYDPIAKENREKLKVPNYWTNKKVNGACQRYWGLTIRIYGGLARRPEITPEGLVMVMCHEFGHAYAGEPYLNAHKKYSAEGLADYYASNTCARMIFEELKLEDYVFPPTPFMEDSCSSFDGEDKEYCLRILVGSKSMATLLAVLMKQDEPDFRTPDQTVVDETLVSYPETAQCRMDSYFAGAMNKPKPACWFKD